MKITNIAKAILLPILMLPIANSKANYKEDTKDRVIPTERILFPEINPVSASVLAIPRNMDPMSLALFELSRKFDRKNYISEIVVDRDRFQEEHIGKYDAFYKVDTGNKGWFYIARKQEARTDTIFVPAFDGNEKKKGMLFLPPPENSTLVSTVDAKEIGLSGAFEIYDKNGWYYVNYKFSPLILTPNHTKVTSTFLLNIERELQKFPSKLTNELTKNGIRIMIAGNVQDAYYHYYPSWKQYDNSLIVDPKKPAYEMTKNGFRDNRKYANTGGMFIDRKVVIPQRYTVYGTNEIYDYATSNYWTKRVLYHELGHAIDYVYEAAFSDTDGFRAAHSADIKPFTEGDINDLAYFYRSRSETFAHLTASLLGGLSRDESAKMLSKFPRCAEHIRQNVLPRFDVELTKEKIRKNIYPGYLKADKQTKLSNAFLHEVNVIIPPDFPQEFVSFPQEKVYRVS